MLSVDQQQLEPVFQYVEHRFPIAAGALHRHMCDILLREPVAQLLQIVAHRAKHAYLLARLLVVARHNRARDDELLVDV
jgi:hypothetical protein